MEHLEKSNMGSFLKFINNFINSNNNELKSCFNKYVNFYDFSQKITLSTILKLYFAFEKS